ncbi:MAG TPA: glycosyltransferase, partial [Ignavibacteriaceae bacterium]|nr:glycosyltransferase [Ignavibacteriaceae bacterium]
NDYDFIFEMDADFSHDPKEIRNFLKAIKDYDLVLGSRYASGISVVNWPMRRLILSYLANLYTRIITGLPVKDATGGFKCFRRQVLESINFDKVKSNGYAFQIEITFKAWKNGFTVVEIPIIFIDRTTGTSKMSKKIVHEAIFMVWKLRLRSIFGHL